MSNFDFVRLIGQQTCKAASHLTEALAAQPACTYSQAGNMGLLVLAAATLTLAAIVIRHRRIRRRQTYFRNRSFF